MLKNVKTNSKHILMEVIMRKISKILVLALLAMLCTASAWAYPQLGPATSSIYFNNWENRISSTGSPLISVGDRFFGIAEIGFISWNDGGSNRDWESAVGDRLQGYFYTEVAAVNIDVNNPTMAQIIFKAPTLSDPYGVISDAELQSGVVLKWFTSATTLNFDSEALGVSSATDGDLWMSLAMTENNGYWWSNALASVGGLTPGSFIGSSWYGLDLVDGAVTYLLPINDDQESLFNDDVQFYGTSDIQSTGQGEEGFGVWQFASADPAVVATPEPSTMLLLGAGLLGLGAVARRRR